MTLQLAIKDFLLEQQFRGNTPKTVQYYALCLRLFAEYAGEDTDLSAISQTTLKGYFLHLSGKAITSTTVQTYFRAIRAFLSWCYNEQLIPDNLPEKFRLPKAQKKTVDVLSNSEMTQLLKCFNLRSAMQLRDCCICSLMMDCGLRLNEVVTLALDHLHLADGYAVVNGKGNKQRIVPIGLYSRRLLLRYLARRPSCVQTHAVFLKSDLTPITDDTLRMMFRRLKNKAGIPRLRAHLLRHTFATNYLENGGDIYTLQTILGHTSLEMVKRYVHFTPGKLESNYMKFSPLDNLGGRKTKTPQRLA